MMEDVIMKKLFVIACAFAVVIGCQKAEMEQPQENEGVKVPVQVTATIAQTKTTMTNEGGVLKSAWKDGDELYVRLLFGSNFVESVKYTASVSGNSVEFITDSEGMAIPDAAYTNAQYRFVAEHPELGYSYSNRYANWRQVVVPDVQEQSAPGNLDHIAKTNVLYALPVRPTMVKDQPISLNFEMIHPLSVLQLNLKGSEEGIKIKNIKVQMLDETGTDFLSISSCQFNQTDGTMQSVKGTNQIQLNLASAAELPIDGYAQFYMTVSPGHAGQTFKVIATTDMGETIEVGSMKVPAENPIPTGVNAVKSFTVNPPAVVEPPVQEEIDYASAIDLSANNATANCYVVNKANQLYKFKATVKGNGVLPASMSESGIETTLSPKTALVLWYAPLTDGNTWEDISPVLLGSVTLKDGYVYFSTPAEFVNGNVVIAVFAEEGLTYSNIEADASTRELTNATILWSWNLWCVKDYSPENEEKTVGNYTIMNRNLGALINGLDIDVSVANDCYRASYAVGNHYQMGRKDPMPSHFGYNSYWTMYVQHWTPNFTPISALQQTGDVMYNKGTGFINHFNNSAETTWAGAVNCAAQLPYLFMSGSASAPYTYNWCPKENNKYCEDLWGDSTTDAGDEIKTMYDPCPPGWMVWTSDAVDALWDYCAEQTSETRGNGIYVGDDMCFPFSSARSSEKGEMSGYVSQYLSWGKTGNPGMTGSVYSCFLTSTYKEYAGFIYTANVQAKCVTTSLPTVTFDKYSYVSDNSVHHQRAARPVRCMKKQ